MYSPIRTVVSAALLLAGLAVHIAAQACPNTNCPVAVTGGKCFSSLAQAIAAAPQKGTVFVRGKVRVGSEIALRKSVSIVGCGGAATVQCAFSSQNGAIFRAASSAGQQIAFQGINFENGGGICSVLRTPELGDGSHPARVGYSALGLRVQGCSFSNFRTQARGGGALFIGRAGTVTISNSRFTNNAALRHPSGKLRWESGGGAVWIRYLHNKLAIDSTTFKGNKHEYQHGNGGALMIDYAYGGATVDFTQGSRFESNSAPGGGALYIGELRGLFRTSATFAYNKNSYGWGTRGGALWLQNAIGARMEVRGQFIGNRATENSADSGNGKGRGGAIATNQLKSTKVLVSAVFRDNVSLGGAAVWDGLSGGTALDRGSKVEFRDCVFQGNKGRGGDLAVTFNRASSGLVTINQSAMKRNLVVG